MLGKEFVGVFLEVEQLRFSYLAIEDVEFYEFPVAFFHRTHAGLSAAGVDAEEGVADRFFIAGEDGFKAGSLVGTRGLDVGEVAEGGKGIEEVDVSLDAAFFHTGAFDDVRDAPGVLVEVLFSLETVPADGHAVVGGVNDVGVIELAHRFDFLEDAADLDVDAFGASELAADFITDGGFIAILPNAGDADFITEVGVAVGEGVF